MRTAATHGSACSYSYCTQSVCSSAPWVGMQRAMVHPHEGEGAGGRLAKPVVPLERSGSSRPGALLVLSRRAHQHH